MISLHLVNWNISDSTYSSCHICHFILLDLGTEYCRAHTCVLYILCIFLLPWYMTMYTKMAFKKTRMLFEAELFIVNYDIVIRFSYIIAISMSYWICCGIFFISFELILKQKWTKWYVSLPTTTETGRVKRKNWAILILYSACFTFPTKNTIKYYNLFIAVFCNSDFISILFNISFVLTVLFSMKMVLIGLITYNTI